MRNMYDLNGNNWSRRAMDDMMIGRNSSSNMERHIDTSSSLNSDHCADGDNMNVSVMDNNGNNVSMNFNWNWNSHYPSSHWG
jgi:hypothetical protein